MPNDIQLTIVDEQVENLEAIGVEEGCSFVCCTTTSLDVSDAEFE